MVPVRLRRQHSGTESTVFDLRDGTNDPIAQAAEPFAELGQRMLALGFERVGLVRAHVGEDVAAAYAEPDRSWLQVNLNAPSVVYRSPDGRMFAEYSLWYDDIASIRFRSRLADGAQCDTVRALERMPQTINPGWLAETGERRQMRGHGPSGGRSTLRVDSDDPGELWAQHQRHLEAFAASRGSQVGTHQSVEDYIELATRALEHGAASLTRVGYVLMFLMIALAIVIAQVAFFVADIGPKEVAVGWLLLWVAFYGTVGPRWLHRVARRLEPWTAPRFVR